MFIMRNNFTINDRYTREEAIEKAVISAAESINLTYDAAKIIYGVVCEPEVWEIDLHLHLGDSKPRTQARGKGYKMLMSFMKDMEYVLPSEVIRCVASGDSRQFSLFAEVFDSELFKQLRNVEARLDDEYTSIPRHIEDAAKSWPKSDLYEMWDTRDFIEFEEWLGHIHILEMRGLDVGPFIRSTVFLRAYSRIILEIISETRSRAWNDEDAVDEVYRKAKEMIKKG